MVPANPVRLKDVVIGIKPTARGLGWVIFESPMSALDWGTITARPSRPGRIVNRLERLLDRYEPVVLAIRKIGLTESHRSRSVLKLQQRVVAIAETRGMHVVQYNREAVTMCFRHLGAPTRYEIALFISQHVEALRHRLPRKQPIWNGESPVMSIFDAASYAYAYFVMHGHA